MAIQGDSLYVGSGDGKLKRLNIGDGKWNMTHEAQLDSKVQSVSVSQDGKELIAGTIGGKIYRVLTADLSYLLHTDAHTGAINDCYFSPKRSDQFVSIDDNGISKIWDLSDYKSIFTGHSGRQIGGSSCCIALDDDSIVTGWKDGFIRAFDRSGQNVIWEVANAHRGSVTSIYCDANYILSGGQDGAVRVWARINKKLLIQFNGKLLKIC